jgi:hypothetical protein
LQFLHVCRETYQYYNLPFCQPKDGKEYKTEFLGEVLEGDRLVTTPYSLKFRTDVDQTVLCEKKLTSDELKKFREAVKQDFYFQVREGDPPDLATAQSLYLWCRCSTTICLFGASSARWRSL